MPHRKKEVRGRMPHHWFRVSPGATGPRANDAKIRKTVRTHGGRVLFVGLDEKGKYFVLVNMSRVKDPKKLRKALKAVAGEAGIVLKSPAEAEKRRRRG
jgi:hypothetical protein